MLRSGLFVNDGIDPPTTRYQQQQRAETTLLVGRSIRDTHGFHQQPSKPTVHYTKLPVFRFHFDNGTPLFLSDTPKRAKRFTAS